MDAMDALLNQAAAKKTTKKKKSDKAVIKVEGESFSETLKKWQEEKKKEESAKAEKNRQADKIRTIGSKERRNHCMSNGFDSSIRLESDDGGIVTVSASNKYSTIDMVEKPELVKIFGKIDFDQFFDENTSVSLTKEALDDQKIFMEMVKVIGAENFAKYFSVTKTLSPTKKLHEGRVTDEGVEKKADAAIDAGILKPNALALKK